MSLFEGLELVKFFTGSSESAGRQPNDEARLPIIRSAVC